MIKELTKLSRMLRANGFRKEANKINNILKKAERPSFPDDAFDDAGFGDDDGFGDAFDSYNAPPLPKPVGKEDAIDYASKANAELLKAKDLPLAERAEKELNIPTKYHINRMSKNDKDGTCDIVFNGEEGQILLTVDSYKYPELCK